MLATPLLIAALALTPGQIFTGLTGACWQTDDMPNESTDTHCFTASDGGQLVMDVHKVRNGNGQVIYEGVTLYRTETGAVTYSYYNSQGDLLPGSAGRADDTITFAPDLTWRLSSDAYDVVMPNGTRHFRKLGPAGEGGL